MQNTLKKTSRDGGKGIRVRVAKETNERKHKCGCILRRVNDHWKIHKHCKQHKPNYQKKADKLIERRGKKRGRGYTKSGHRPAYKKEK